MIVKILKDKKAVLADSQHWSRDIMILIDTNRKKKAVIHLQITGDRILVPKWVDVDKNSLGNYIYVSDDLQVLFGELKSTDTLDVDEGYCICLINKATQQYYQHGIWQNISHEFEESTTEDNSKTGS